MEQEEKTVTTQTEETVEQTSAETSTTETAQTDVANQTETKGEGEKEKRTREERERDSAFAKMRRENERLKNENEKLQKKAQSNISEKALTDLGFNKDDLSDEDNMELAEAYMEAVKNGDENPKASAYASVYNNRKATEKAKKQEEEAVKAKQAEIDKAVEKSANEFREAYGNDELIKIMQEDSDFFKKYGKMVTSHPDLLNDCYQLWKSTTPNVDEEAERAKSAGVLPKGNYSGQTKDANYYRNMKREDVLKLNSKELDIWAQANGIRLR